MPRTPLATTLQTFSTRRQFLGAAGAATAAAAVWSPPRAFAAGEKVVVVGGGLAGLTCAYRLREKGVLAQVHEASARFGGRCWTIRGAFADGQYAEHGGELIDTGHLEIRQLNQQLGLTEINLLQAELNGTEALYYFDGAPYTVTEAEADFNAVYQKLHRDVSDASYPTTYKLSTPRGEQLDRMSIVQWIEESVPGGMASRFGQLLDVAYNIEFGATCDDQSALNLLYLLGYSGQGKLRLFGPSNEKYRIRGGNDLLVDRLVEALPGQLVPSSELVAIRRTATGRYTLSFREGSGTRHVTADRVVLALPFSILRRSVDFRNAGFGAVKQRAIRELGMGVNAKLNVGFDRRTWALDNGCNGDTFADTGYQATWEVSRGQAGASGILVDYTGAPAPSGTAANRTRTFLSQLEPVLPGVGAAHDGRATLDAWATYPWTRGSYSFYRVGQYTAFGGAEEEPSGACFFAGEHTTQDFQGYLNGAVFSGNRAASEVLASLPR